jgi:hypothetical protein
MKLGQPFAVIRQQFAQPSYKLPADRCLGLRPQRRHIRLAEEKPWMLAGRGFNESVDRGRLRFLRHATGASSNRGHNAQGYDSYHAFNSYCQKSIT